MRTTDEAQERRLLRLLFLWRRAMSADPGGAGWSRRGRRVAEKSMADRGTQRDWAADRATLAAVWGLPALAMLLAVLLLQPMVCCIVWIANLAWMGGACIANARRCDRTHCRYTGPFFLAMTGLVLAHAAGLVPLGSQPWLVLGLLIAVGNAVIWWGSERLFGTYSRRARHLQTETPPSSVFGP